MINITLAIVTLLALAVAAIASVLAWTATRDERRRAAARVAILSAAIHDRTDDLPLRPTTSRGERSESVFEPTGVPRTRLMIGVVAALVIGVFAGLLLVGTSRSREAHPRPARVIGADAPLELVALEHDRDDSRLVVRGIVRNPISAATINGLTAVVLVFSRDGEFIASGRAPVAASALAPGAETPFVVTLQDADSVDKYRVSFRAGNRVVTHVDRRGRNTIARTE
jgi:hypothetical protein